MDLLEFMNPTRPFTFKKARKDGFTFVELLVVLVTVAILALLLLPALASTKPNSQAFQCLENQRQLTLAWQMYAEDNNGKLPPNADQEVQPNIQNDPNILPGGKWVQWCPGLMNAFSPNWTNYMQLGVIYPYVKNIAVYKCPADNGPSSIISFNAGNGVVAHFPKPRSYSMNCYLAPITPWNDGGNPYRDFFKDTDLVHPGPSTTYVLIDECAASINDAFIVIDPGQQNPGQPYWQDTPASRHGNAGGLSFADGHSEIRSYKDKQLLAANALVSGVKNPLGLGDPSSGDAAWICARATSLMH